MSDEALRRHRPRVVATAWRLSRRLPLHVDLDELVQVGMIGAWQALQSHRPDAGASIETWVERRARGAMIEELRRSDPLSRGDRAAARTRMLATARLEQLLGRPPRRAELAAKLGWTDVQLRATDTISHSVTWDEFCDVTHDPSKAPLAEVLERERAARLEVELARLPARSRDMLRLLLDGMTQRDVGALFGLSEQRVGQIAAETVALLAARLAEPAAAGIGCRQSAPDGRPLGYYSGARVG